MRSCTCAVRCKPGVAVPHGGGWSAPPHGFAFHLYVYSSGTVRNHFNMHTVTHSNHVAICHLHLAGPFPPRREVLESDGWCTEDDDIQFMHQCRSSARVQASLCVACGVQPWACGCHRGFQYPCGRPPLSAGVPLDAVRVTLTLMLLLAAVCAYVSAATRLEGRLASWRLDVGRLPVPNSSTPAASTTPVVGCCNRVVRRSSAVPALSRFPLTVTLLPRTPELVNC
jgi:hypothetical protein